VFSGATDLVSMGAGKLAGNLTKKGVDKFAKTALGESVLKKANSVKGKVLNKLSGVKTKTQAIVKTESNKLKSKFSKVAKEASRVKKSEMVKVDLQLFAKKSAPEPEVQNFIQKFEKKYPGRKYKSGHFGVHSDGRNNIEIDFETDNVILEFKRGNGNGLTRQIKDRLDSKVNPNGKVVIGVPGKRMSRFAQRDVEKAGGLMTNDIDLILELIKPD